MFVKLIIVLEGIILFLMDKTQTTQLSVNPQVRQPAEQIPETVARTDKPWFKIILFSVLGIIVAVGLVFVGFVFAVLNKDIFKPREPVPVITSTPTPAPDPTANWETYTDEKGKFSFKYPPYFTIKNELNDPNASEYTKTFATFITLGQTEATGSSVLGSVRLSTRESASKLEKEDFDYMEGHIVFKIIGRQTIKLGSRDATQVLLRVGETESQSQYLYLNLDGGSLGIQFPADQQRKPLFDLILSTFKFISKGNIGEKVFCKNPRPEVCTMECITNPPYICGSNGKSYCTECQACSDPQVEWYSIRPWKCDLY